MAIPAEIISWFRDVFAEANKRVTEKIQNVPSIHESHLDTTLIEHLLGYATPRVFAAGWTVKLETHYIGGLRHWRTWEIADIGVFVFFQQRGRIARRKVALLQSKRLYPAVGDVEHLEKFDYMLGMARIADKDDAQNSLLTPKKFKFTSSAKYKALVRGDDQQKAMQEHFDKYGVPIFYLLYNPPLKFRLSTFR